MNNQASLPVNPRAGLDYRSDIDGLRALAVIAVLIFHAFPDALPGGYIGVDIFFVISGYLISGIIFRSLRRGHFSFRDFYARRIRRIFPCLILVLLVSYAAGWFLLLPGPFQQLGRQIAASAGFVQNMVLWTEAGYFDTATELKPLMHLWSLSIEEQFYLIFPLLIYSLWSLRERQRGMWLVLLALGSFLLNLYAIRADVAGAFFLAPPRFWELLAGGLLAYVQAFAPAVTQRLSQGREHVFSVVGVGLIGAGFILIHPDSTFPGWWALLPVAGTFLLVTAGPNAWVNHHFLARPAVVWVGLISYPLYLWHWPILVYLRILQAGIPPWSWRVGALALSVILAWLTWRFVERPIRFGYRTWIKTAVLSCVLVLVGYLGYNVEQRQGLAFRFPEPVRALLSYQYDYRDGYREGSCFLRPEQDAAAFAQCADTGEPAAGQLLLWGDSHAAHLYQGVLDRFGQRWSIRQRNASGCPPIPGLVVADRPHCKAINDHVLDEIRAHPPRAVLLAAAWPTYDWARLAETVDFLQALGVTQIAIIGPVPQWTDGLPRQLLRYLGDHPLDAQLPHYLAQGLDPAPRQTDTRLAALAAALGVAYASPISVLCPHKGCLTYLDDEARTITAWDYGHLTGAASVFVMQHLGLPHWAPVPRQQ